MPRGLGRRDREAARLALRAPPLAALAEDEVRGDAGAGGRRLHRSAGRARRPRRAARRLLRRATTSSSPARSAPASTRSCCSTCARGSTRSRSRSRRSRKAIGLAARCARTGCVPRSSCRSPSSSGPCTASCAIRACSASAPTSRRARSCGRRRDHAPREGAVPRRRHHQGRARRLLRGDRAGDAAAHPRAARSRWSATPPASARRASCRRTSRRASPSGCERVEVPKKDGTVHHPLVTDARSLLWLANQNMHHAARVDVARAGPVPPRHLRLRSRPVATTSPTCCARAALALRDLLDELGPAELGEDVRLEGLPHRRAARRQGRLRRGRAASRTPSARCSSQRDPEHLTQEFSKADRGGRILVDTGRNGYSATFAAAYAVRAKPGAPVSAPCTWEELERGDVGPRTFTLRTMAGRIADVGDLWSDMRKRRRSLRRPDRAAAAHAA